MRQELPEHGNIASSFAFFSGLQIKEDAKILDIGTRFGSFVQALSAAGYAQAYGIDVDPGPIRQGKSVHADIASRLQNYDGKAIPFPDGNFDVVTMFDVIEHIPEVDRFLKQEVCRVLRPGGKLIFQTPNKWVNIPWEILNNRSLTRWRTYHCSLQGLGALRKLLENTGFSNVCIEKNEIRTSHNLAKVRKVLGPPGSWLLNIFQHLPLFIYPNLWGTAIKFVEAGKN